MWRQWPWRLLHILIFSCGDRVKFGGCVPDGLLLAVIVAGAYNTNSSIVVGCFTWSGSIYGLFFRILSLLSAFVVF